MYLFIFLAFLALTIVNIILIGRSQSNTQEEVVVNDEGFVQVKQLANLSLSPLSAILLAVNFILFALLANYIILNRLNLRYLSFVLIILVVFGVLLYLLREGFKDRLPISDRWFVLLGILGGILTLAYTIFGGRTTFMRKPTRPW